MQRNMALCNMYVIFCPVLTKIQFLWKILVQFPNTKLHENLSHISQGVTCKETRQSYWHISETFRCKCGKPVTALTLVSTSDVRQHHENCTYYNSYILNNE